MTKRVSINKSTRIYQSHIKSLFHKLSRLQINIDAQIIKVHLNEEKTTSKAMTGTFQWKYPMFNLRIRNFVAQDMK